MELHTTTTTNTTTPSSALKNSSPHTVHVVIFLGRHTPSSLCLCAAFPPPHHCHIHPPTPHSHVRLCCKQSFLPSICISQVFPEPPCTAGPWLECRLWFAVCRSAPAALPHRPHPDRPPTPHIDICVAVRGVRESALTSKGQSLRKKERQKKERRKC